MIISPLEKVPISIFSCPRGLSSLVTGSYCVVSYYEVWDSAAGVGGGGGGDGGEGGEGDVCI